MRDEGKLGGVARVVGPPVVQIVTDGECLQGTLENLGLGHGAKPLSPASLAKAKTDALILLEDVLRAYDAEVASGVPRAT